MNKLKYTVVVDNIESQTLRGEWGLCIYIEYGDKKILLDTGASNLFAKNAEALGIDLSQVDIAALSHAHYDHANGMEKFFQLNDKAKFYVQEATSDNCYYRYWFIHKYIGIPKGILARFSDRIAYTKGKEQIAEGIYILGHTTEGLSAIGKREKMYQKKDGRYYPDDFSHEQSLIFETDKGLVVFNSCSHGGAANIIREVQKAFPGESVYALIGGFHLYNKPESEIKDLAAKIKETGAQYICTGHCSEKKGCRILTEELGDIMHTLQVGLVEEF
ncbi:MAG: MBL fold metallo-hydrolase [Clostridiales bacterium]|nr:MBL fold metallo-hydrolase [Candidatus Crickella merdequi]